MLRCSSLKYPPIKPNIRPIPKFFITQVEALEDSPYRMFVAHTGEGGRYAGYFNCRPSTIIKGDDVVKSMYISEIFSFEPGAGTALLNYARYLSRINDCDGNIHLVASGCYAPQRVPHLFYRKYGMNTGKKSLDKKMDLFIKKDKTAAVSDFDNVLMYYPPVAYPKKNTMLHKFVRFVQNIFATPQKNMAR